MHRQLRDDFLAARQVFQTAIARNPVSPAPHAWLAKWHILYILHGMSATPAQDFAEASASAARALECDADDALALAVAAHVSAWARHDFYSAERCFNQALAGNTHETFA